MSRFEDMFDDFMDKARSVADTATKKTGEVVDMSKIRYEIKQTQWDIEKTYAKLGAIYYESRKSSESFEEVIELALSEIDALVNKLEELEVRLRSYKKVTKCPSCGKENDQSFFFCSRCGADIRPPEPEPEPVEAEVVEPAQEPSPSQEEAPKSSYYDSGDQQ